MIINLAEIPEEGRNYEYSTESGEVTETLADLIGDNHYVTQFFIRPLNSRDFSLTGSIKTKSKEICSYCGQGIKFPVNVKFNEILIPPQEMTRDGHYAKPNHFDENEAEGPQSFEYSPGMKLAIGEYLHETIALNVPFNPAPEITEKGDCGDCGLNVQTVIKSYEEAPETDEATNPFAVLKSLKVTQ
ncbi:MAG: DUF177 domain-containing protein [Bdellovibrionaceae bacterium]|nr:DUF177 domain-containing protein [Pseudobdellovibrionaceae bacterium]